MTSPGRGFQLVFLISNNLGENTTDGNAGASVNCDPAPNVEIVESDEGVDDLIPKEIAEKLAVGSNGTQRAAKIFCRESAQLVTRIVL